MRRDPRLGRVLEVECDDLARAMAVLQSLEEVLDIGVFGSALHVTAVEAMGDPARLAAALQRAGLRISRIESVEPSLEDTFVQMVGAAVQERSSP